jgi:hypothetical protein
MNYKTPFNITDKYVLPVMRLIDKRIQAMPTKPHVHVYSNQYNAFLNSIPYSIRNRYESQIEIINLTTGNTYFILPI